MKINYMICLSRFACKITPLVKVVSAEGNVFCPILNTAGFHVLQIHLSCSTDFNTESHFVNIRNFQSCLL